jgi:hypothetical protein
MESTDGLPRLQPRHDIDGYVDVIPLLAAAGPV